MKTTQIALFTVTMLISSSAHTATRLEINLNTEIDMRNGYVIAKEYGGSGRYVLINHSHGKFESSDIVRAVCSDGYVVMNLPKKFSKVSKVLKAADFIFTNCKED